MSETVRPLQSLAAQNTELARKVLADPDASEHDKRLARIVLYGAFDEAQEVAS